MIYRHKKRGTFYTIIAEGRLQLDGDHDMSPVVIYRDINTGEIWVRRKEEFFDGRFEEASNA